MSNDDLKPLNDELKKLKTAIEHIKSMETTLPADPYHAVITPLYARQDTLENKIAELKGSGAIAQGDDSIAVGKNGIAIIAKGGGNVIINQNTHDAPSLDPGHHLRNAYLNKVKNDTGILPLEGIDPKAMSNSGVNSLSLSAIYTALMTSGNFHEKSEDLPHSKEIQRVSALEHLNHHQHMVLLGDPGSGKSTFVNFLALCFAGEGLSHKTININLLTQPVADKGENKEKTKQPWDHGPLLPLRIILRDFAASEISKQCACANTMWQFIHQELQRAELGDFTEVMKREFRSKGGLILFDGLDEVPEAENRRGDIRKMVEDVMTSFSKCRIVITSRTYAYQKQAFRIPNLFEAVLAPFTKGQIHRFITQWYLYEAENRYWKKEDAMGKAEILKRAIFNSSRLRALAERPLLLTLMASLHAWRGGTLPEKREELYADTVDLLLDQWERRKMGRSSKGETKAIEPSLAEFLKVDRDQIRKLLNELAYNAHSQQEDFQGTADISGKDLISGLVNLSNEKETVNMKKLIRFLNDRSGLLIERGVGIYTFPHRMFQEYLAACYLTEFDFPKEAASLARKDPDRWREVVLLAGAKAARGTSSAIWQLAEELYVEDPDQKDEKLNTEWGALFAGQALAESADLQKVSNRNISKLEKVRKLQIRILEGDQLPAVERALAGRNLAQLGDTRKEVMGVEHMSFCLVPKGPFYMGDGKKQHLNESLNEDFWIGRYLVTNAQYDEFVKAEGYKNKSYWEEAEKAGFWKNRGFKSRESVEDFGVPFNFTNHPVVGVTWYEALAFTRWLTDHYREKGFISENSRIRLPSEAEWEKAARGGQMIPEYPVMVSVLEKGWGQKVEVIPNSTEKRVYPWGDQIDKEHANHYETGIGSTSSLGCFSTGKGPCGCLDMSGNVWEWTRSIYGYPYPYTPSAEREDESADVQRHRVLRGGAFIYAAESLSCAARGRYDPLSRLNSIGFRCEFSLNSL